MLFEVLPHLVTRMQPPCSVQLRNYIPFPGGSVYSYGGTRALREQRMSIATSIQYKDRSAFVSYYILSL